ncbi:MAG TPA: ferrous iron transport protein B [Pirellulaceae bacterium]|nr:ferrous iron transport protein B [Pirellulaceae bacterium]
MSSTSSGSGAGSSPVNSRDTASARTSGSEPAPGRSPDSPVTVALIGNPNTGKSTLFNALSGVRQRTGNYPGVTVEKKEGRLKIGERQFTIVDLPGTYSLAPRSPDEMIAVDVLLGRRSDVSRPDVVLCIVDASNLERNLYLVSQVLELGLPTVLALNMVDVAESKGLVLDQKRLREQLGLPVVSIQANRKVGVDELKNELLAAADRTGKAPSSPLPEAFQDEVARLEAATVGAEGGALPRYLIERLILDTTGYLERAGLVGVDAQLLEQIRATRQHLASKGLPVPGVEAMSRYAWVAKVLAGVIQRPAKRKVTAGDKVDRVLTHRVWGTLTFVLLMIAMFQSVFWIAEPAKAGLDWVKELLSKAVESRMEEGALRSLLVSGVIEGVGGVLIFLPQIFTLFFFIAVLEDCGYMARAAYLMDRLMSRIGLSGKSFIPLLSSFACAIPGIMATRVIENRRDRLVTILVAPLMSCSARMPVYMLLVSAFIPNTKLISFPFPNVPVLGKLGLGLPGLTIFAMYALGVIAAIVVALLLKKTILSGTTPPFVMELPSYKLPGLGIVLFRMLDRGWAFVRRAGTLILAVSIVVWAAAYYPRNASEIDATVVERPTKIQAELDDIKLRIDALATDAGADARAELDQLHEATSERLASAQHELEGLYLRNSYLGRLGHLIEPVVKPLGWDWRIGCAALASFPAREVVVATLGVIYNLGAETEAESETLHDTLRGATWDGTGEKVFNVPVALSLMVFFSLCAQCVSTLAVIRRETNSWSWPAFTFAYMTGLAYVAALITYQVGMRIGG